jgi:hypothetical protein
VWGVLLAAYLAFLAVVLLAPSPDLPTAALAAAADWGRDAGLPEGLLIPSRLEFAANAAIVVPAPVIAARLWPRRTWTDWTAYAFGVSFAIEAIQALVLPNRSASFVDVVANTLGACLGGLATSLTLARADTDGADERRAWRR